jgi:hypothetical protein
MSTAQRAIAARMAARRAARVERRGVDLFDAEAFGPGPGGLDPPPPGELRRIWRWFRAHELPAQVVLVLMAVTVAYLAAAFGLLIDAGIAPWLGG